MIHLYSRNRGFTVVELVIVIVVIGILATIAVVSYSGAQNRAYDVAVQSDLRSMGDQLEVARVSGVTIPNNEDLLSKADIQLSKKAYGADYIDTSSGYKYNALYCSTVPGYEPQNFAFIASSRSGNVYSYVNDRVTSFPASTWKTSWGWGDMCPTILKVASGNSSTGIWLYENSIWKIWLK